MANMFELHESNGSREPDNIAWQVIRESAQILAEKLEFLGYNTKEESLINFESIEDAFRQLELQIEVFNRVVARLKGHITADQRQKWRQFAPILSNKLHHLLTTARRMCSVNINGRILKNLGHNNSLNCKTILDETGKLIEDAGKELRTLIDYYK